MKNNHEISLRLRRTTRNSIASCQSPFGSWWGTILSVIILCNLVVPIFHFTFAIASEGDFLLKAGKVELVRTSEGRVSLLKGGVTIHHQGTVITGREGKIFEEEERALLQGEVRVSDKETFFSGDEGEYFKKEELAILRGKVEMTHGEMRLHSDTLTYYRKTGYSEMRGNVELWDEKNKIQVKGNEGWHDFTSDQSGMTRNPILITTGEKKEVRIEAERMKILREEDVAVAVGKVKINQEDVEITCDSLLYSLQEEKANLSGMPVLRDTDDEIQGDEALLFFRNRELELAIMKGNAKGITHPNQGERNEVEGEEIRISFENGNAEKISIEGGAKGKYFRH